MNAVGIIPARSGSKRLAGFFLVACKIWVACKQSLGDYATDVKVVELLEPVFSGGLDRTADGVVETLFLEPEAEFGLGVLLW